eukprot:2573442-Rhodomonas_salina.3
MCDVCGQEAEQADGDNLFGPTVPSHLPVTNASDAKSEGAEEGVEEEEEEEEEGGEEEGGEEEGGCLLYTSDAADDM